METNKVSVSLYDAKEKKLIGVFESYQLATKYLFKNYKESHVKRCYNALLTKTKIIQDTIFDFPVVARISNPMQIKLLGKDSCYINTEYPQRMNKQGRLI